MLGTLSVLFLVVILAEVKSVPSETCRQSYDRCVKSSFADTLILYNISAWSLSDVLPSWNATILPQLCSDYEQFSNCMPTARCSITDQLLLAGIDDAWAFLCNNTSPDAAYYNYSKCYRQPNAIQGTIYCNNTVSTKLGRLGNLDSQNNVRLACKYYDEYVTCLLASTNSVCGPSAADWHQTYIVHLLTPYVSQILECSDWGVNGSGSDDDDNTGGILVTVFVALSLLLMLFIVVVLAVVVARRRAKNQSFSQSSAASSGIQDSSDTAPPNYTEPYVIIEQTTPEVTAPFGTSENSHPEANDGSNGGPQYRIRLVDPLTGRRTDGGVVNGNEFPLKTWPTTEMMVPPPYNDQPPPSFSSQLGPDDVGGSESSSGVCGVVGQSTEAATAAADNYGFCPDADEKPKLPED